MQGLREEGGDGDSYVPGKVSLPAGAGRIVQVSAGESPAPGLQIALWRIFQTSVGPGCIRVAVTLSCAAGAPFCSDPALHVFLPLFIRPRSRGRVCDPQRRSEILDRAAGDSHTAALTEAGAVYGWGTFRDGSGVMGFSDAERIQLVPVNVYEPTAADAQAVKVVSGPHSSSEVQALVVSPNIRIKQQLWKYSSHKME